jgi:hypothetical protein
MQDVRRKFENKNWVRLNRWKALPLTASPLFFLFAKKKDMSAPEPESFGFQAEISQLLDLIIS